MTPKFEHAYYQNGNYSNYLERKFANLATDLVQHLALLPEHHIIDYGCGCGGLLAEFAELGFTDLHGTDISQWAIDHGKEQYPWIADQLHYYSRDLLTWPKDYVFMLDVLEHMPEYEIAFVLKTARKNLRKGIVIRIPVCEIEGKPFVLAVSNNDRTHICCHTKTWWKKMFLDCGYPNYGAIIGTAIYESEGVMAGLFTP